MNDATEYETRHGHLQLPLKVGDRVSLIDGCAAVTKFVEGSKKYGIIKKIRYITDSEESVEVSEWMPGAALKIGTQVRVIHTLIDEGKRS